MSWNLSLHSTLTMGDSRKYPYLYHGWLLGFPKGSGVVWTGILKEWGVFTIGNPKAWGGFTGGISRVERVEWTVKRGFHLYLDESLVTWIKSENVPYRLQISWYSRLPPDKQQKTCTCPSLPKNASQIIKHSDCRTAIGGRLGRTRSGLREGNVLGKMYEVSFFLIAIK